MPVTCKDGVSSTFSMKPLAMLRSKIFLLPDVKSRSIQAHNQEFIVTTLCRVCLKRNVQANKSRWTQQCVPVSATTQT